MSTPAEDREADAFAAALGVVTTGSRPTADDIQRLEELVLFVRPAADDVERSAVATFERLAAG